MAVCQFYLRGQCKFGDSCRNEHPPQGGGGFGATSWGRPSATGPVKMDLPYNAANIAQDLNPTGEKPIWPLSSYAPFKHETILIGGLDISPEELRVKAIAAVNGGNVSEYVQYEANQIAAAEQVYNAARTNMKQTFEQATKQSRLLTGGTPTSAFPSTSSAFNTVGTSAFGNTPSGSNATSSAFGASSISTFGKPAFGQTPPIQTGFGQPSISTAAFGQPTTGQPTSGQQPSTTSAFGQPSSVQTNPLSGTSDAASVIRPSSGAFGAFAGSRPSAFGAGAPPSSNSSDTTGGGFSAFAGQPTAFGSPAGGFGQPSASTGTASTVGQPQQTGNAFSALTSNSSSVFGSFGAPAPPTEPRTTTAQSVSVFGPFGELNTDSSAQQPVSVFGQSASHLNVSPSGLVPSISMASANSGGSAFAASPMATINPNAVAAKLSPEGSSSKTIDFSAIISRTTYRPGSTPYDSQLPPNYSGMLPERATKAFRKERFGWAWEDGEAAMPEWIPPVDVR